MSKERNELLDLLKGFAILLVVLGHAVQHNLPKTFDSHPIFRVIYSFHMPLFMFISGYVSCISFKGNIGTLFSRLRTLMLPFWSWFFFSYFFYWAIHYNQHHQLPDFNYKFFALLRNPGRGLWFLWVLFANYVFLYLSLKITRKHAVFILFVVYIFINVINMYFKPVADMATIGWYLLFFLSGYALKQYNVIDTKFFTRLSYLSLLAFPILVWSWNRNCTVQLSLLFKQDVNLQNAASYIYGLLVPFTGIFMSFAIMGFALKLPAFIKSLFLYTGKISLEIYSTHFYLFTLLFLISAVEINTRIFVTFVYVLIFSIIFQWLLKTNKITTLIFYGKIKR